MIAGVYSRDGSVPIPDLICSKIKRLLSRSPDDKVQVFKDGRSFFARVDIGAFGSKGEYVGESGDITLVAGEPLISSDPEKSRWHDLVEIQRSFATNSHAIFTSACGVFAAINYQPESGQLSLVTDKLGIRPVYYSITSDFVFFSSALRLLEELPEIPKRMHVRAVTEIAGLGYALAGRTPYKEISVLKAGEILQAKDQDISLETYWRWDEIEQTTADENEVLDELYRRFKDAVARRLRGDASTIAYLSGGLDSRCIVSELCAQQTHVHSFNFARQDTQDQILGRLYAGAIDVTHTEMPKMVGDHKPDYSSMMARAWVDHGSDSNIPERTAIAWSGEGGSVALGHVHLSQKIVSLMRDGNPLAAIDEFIRGEYIYISRNLIRSSVFKELEKVIPNGIREELDGLRSQDPARSFYLFLMLNDQRCKLAGHFEDLDLHRLELQLPFFDSSFVEWIVSIPVDLCLEHRLYVKWLTRFPESVTAVPWQAYPGHVPCSLPIPEGLSYQWSKPYQAAERNALKRNLEQQARRLIGSKDFADGILNKNSIRLAALMHRTGWRDYGYIIETAEIYQKYWTKCNGDHIYV